MKLFIETKIYIVIYLFIQNCDLLFPIIKIVIFKKKILLYDVIFTSKGRLTEIFIYYILFLLCTSG